MDVELLVTKGLGDNSYLIGSGDEAAVVDPQRDVDPYLELARQHRWGIRAILETHVHNDYISGARELQHRTGASIAGPAEAGYGFEWTPLGEGDEVSIGDVRLLAMATPGHTPEHTSYLAFGGGSEDPTAVFTGGSLMVGGAGRTDLLGALRADELTRAQYRTLRRLAELPAGTRVFPTHGAGSFCGAGPAPKERTSTVELERRTNRALGSPDEDAFVRQQLSGLLAFPAYYREMAPLNRAGPRVLGPRAQPVPLSADEAASHLERGAWVVDARPREVFAAAHVPGALNVELDDTFSSYVGWLTPFDASIVLVVPEPEAEAAREAITQLLRIGYERVVGFVAGGVESWRSSGRPVGSYHAYSFQDLCRVLDAGEQPPVLDVRQQVEWEKGHIAGSTHLFVGELPARMAEVPAPEAGVWVICATGHRSSMAASLLERASIPARLVARGGVRDVLAACGPAR